MLTVTLMIACETAGLADRPGWRSTKIRDGYFIDRKSLRWPSTLFDVLGSLDVPPCEVGPVRTAGSEDSFDPAGLVTGRETFVVEAAPPRALDRPRFLGDLHLGRLVRHLRVLGFDTAWETSGSEAAVAERAVAEERVVLSRNIALLKRRTMREAMLVLSDDPDRQLVQVLRRFRLAGRVRMFGRCGRCNGVLAAVAKSEVADRIPPKTAAWLDEYYLCGDCDQLFWEGTHVLAMRSRLTALLAGIRDEDR